jgi:hypothetical protein
MPYGKNNNAPTSANVSGTNHFEATGDINWPPHSLDLSAPDYFFMGIFKI